MLVVAPDDTEPDGLGSNTKKGNCSASWRDLFNTMKSQHVIFKMVKSCWLNKSLMSLIEMEPHNVPVTASNGTQRKNGTNWINIIASNMIHVLGTIKTTADSNARNGMLVNVAQHYRVHGLEERVREKELEKKTTNPFKPRQQMGTHCAWAEQGNDLATWICNQHPLDRV